MAKNRRGLGRGIGALIPESQKESTDSPIGIFFGQSVVTTPKTKEENTGVEITGNQEQNNVSRETSQSTLSQKIENNEIGETKQGSIRTSDDSLTPPRKDRLTHSTKKEASSSLTKQNIKKNDGDTNVSRETFTQSRENKKANPSVDDTEELQKVPGATYGEIPLSYIIPNRKQPRNIFDEEDLQELADSIKEVGVLQPIIIRPLESSVAEKPEARYELIMGERRWRASQRAGLESIPAIVRRTQDEDLLRDALLENLHRAQLNPLEEAAAYAQLLEDFHCTQEELSKRIARSRPQITNTLRLLKLPSLVQRRVAAGVLSAGHARALLGLSDAGEMEVLAQRIVAEGLSVRKVEEIVALGVEEDKPRVPRVTKRDPALENLSTLLGDKLDTKVQVKMGARKGSIRIDFGNIDDLKRILELLSLGGFEY